MLSTSSCREKFWKFFYQHFWSKIISDTFFSFYFQFLIILTVLPILTYSIPAPDYSDSTLDPAEIQVPEDLYDQSRTKRSGFDIGALKQVRIWKV